MRYGRELRLTAVVGASTVRLLGNPLLRSKLLVDPQRAGMLDSIPLVGLSAYISRSVARQDFTRWRFIHRFPRDGYVVSLPLAFESPVVLDQVSIAVPENMRAVISAAGLPYSSLVKAKNMFSTTGGSLDDEGGGSDRVTLVAGSRLWLRAHLQRPRVQA